MHNAVVQIIIVVLLIMLAFVMQNWRTKRFNYQCASCGERFSLSAWKAVLAVHMMGTKYVKCPKCGKWGWAKPVPKPED